MRMCHSFIDKNELSTDEFAKLLHIRGGNLILLIFREQKLKHSELINKINKINFHGQ